MAAKNPTLTAPQVPPDVAAFAAEQGVADHLPEVLDMTRRLFPAARCLELSLEPDGDIADSWYIVFRVVAATTVEQAVAGQKDWCREVLRSCPRPSPFVLALEPVGV